MSIPVDSIHDIVTHLAYRMYEQDGKPEGRAEEHWARAERALGMMSDDSQALSPEIPSEVSP